MAGVEGSATYIIICMTAFTISNILGDQGVVDINIYFCLRYTLLVGKPPFETQTLKDTYLRIKKNEYHIPSRVGPLARSLIQKLLQADPLQRPCVSKIIEDDFMTMGEC